MADVEVRRGSGSLVTETKKTRKVKKTKRRESSDQGSEITITEIEQTTTTENQDTQDVDEEGYVCIRTGKIIQFLCIICLISWTRLPRRWWWMTNQSSNET